MVVMMANCVPLLLLLLAQPTVELQPHSVQASRRALLHHAAASTALLLAPGAALAKRKSSAQEAPKCYDPKFNEIPCQATMSDVLKTTDDDLPEGWRSGLGAPVANPTMVTRTYAGDEVMAGSGNANQPLRTFIPSGAETQISSNEGVVPEKAAAKVRPGEIDVNNMIGVEFSTCVLGGRRTAQKARTCLSGHCEAGGRGRSLCVRALADPGLYPTISSKLVKRGPFATKQDLYAALDSDAERAALKVFDKGIILKARDDDLLQYKNAGFYFKGKGGDTKRSSDYRDEEIKRLQNERKGNR